MSIYKKLEKNKDIIKNHKKKDLIPLFENAMFLFKGGGWQYSQNNQFVDSPNVSINSYFVNQNNDFSVTYISNQNKNDYQTYLPWNNFMSSVGAPYNSETGEYEYIVEGTQINRAVVVQFNRENFEEKIDYDNFYLSMSNRTDDTSDSISGTNFNLNTFLVLAPFFNKNRSHTTADDTVLPIESYELRTSSNSQFLTFNQSDSSIKIDWDQGDVSGVVGELFPTLGCAVIYLQKIPPAYNTLSQTISEANDKSLTALNSLMYVGGYGVKIQSEEIIFVRLNNSEYNFTSNPTAFRNLAGIEEYLNRLENENTTYPTCVGLFNDQNECLATITLSKPEKKSPLTELPLRVKLNI